MFPYLNMLHMGRIFPFRNVAFKKKVRYLPSSDGITKPWETLSVLFESLESCSDLWSLFSPFPSPTASVVIALDRTGTAESFKIRVHFITIASYILNTILNLIL